MTQPWQHLFTSILGASNTSQYWGYFVEYFLLPCILLLIFLIVIIFWDHPLWTNLRLIQQNHQLRQRVARFIAENDQLLQDVARLVPENEELREKVTKLQEEMNHLIEDNVNYAQQNAKLEYENYRLKDGRLFDYS